MGAELPAEETLYLEVVQMQIETATFNDDGWIFGERLEVNGVNTRTTVSTNSGHHIAEFIEVKDKNEIKWSTDQSVEEAGWLVCLRLKKKIPKVHQATCSQIGDDIWSMYFITDDPNEVVSVECDMTKCNKEKVKHVTDERYKFLRTTNVCDADGRLLGRASSIWSSRVPVRPERRPSRCCSDSTRPICFIPKTRESAMVRQKWRL